VLEVVEYEVCVGNDLLQDLPIGVAARVEGCVISPLLQGSEEY
jgi:hypothetical protein